MPDAAFIMSGQKREIFKETCFFQDSIVTLLV
eukprot:CAMPEP_0169313500 /NCGR_PEP_ID=MMETSP1017-20121227/4611_1 /TAXON_ID=342587 /ORGANISM="Karlodinium micrum, Strain CCMP2283" /LENGTH=31 /DNA_ID= /DNA_START= /DNA_END= /DNA_ORIENTATION=